MGNCQTVKIFPARNDHEHSVVEDIIHEVSRKLHSVSVLRSMLTGSALVVVVCIGALMALMMWVATLEEDVEQGGIDSAHPAPYWELVFLMWAGMFICSALFGFAFSFEGFRKMARGSLEYTTLVIYELKRGQCYGYEEHLQASVEESDEQRLCREKHQLKVEAGLAGWTEEMIVEQISRLEDAYEAKNKVEDVESRPTDQFKKSVAIVRTETLKLFSMVRNTIRANHCVLGTVTCTFALTTVGIGAMGAFLTIKIANMPNPDDNPLWIERCWQLINAIFSVIAVWKGPQRVLLLHYWIRREWVEKDLVKDKAGVPRSLLSPGALLEHRQVGIIAGLRITNIVCQYIVCFFMWAWLPRCLQEEKEQKIDCTSRPAWGVPVFLVLGMGTDIGSSALLSSFIASCPYRKWPIEATTAIGTILEYRGTMLT